MKHRIGHTGGGRGPWAQPKSGMIPSPASEMAQIQAVKPKPRKPGPVSPGKHAPKVGPTHGISKRMVWGG